MKTLLQHAAELNAHPDVAVAEVVNGAVKVTLRGGICVYTLETLADLEWFREKFLGPVTGKEAST